MPLASDKPAPPAAAGDLPCHADPDRASLKEAAGAGREEKTQRPAEEKQDAASKDIAALPEETAVIGVPLADARSIPPPASDTQAPCEKGQEAAAAAALASSPGPETGTQVDREDVLFHSQDATLSPPTRRSWPWLLGNVVLLLLALAQIAHYWREDIAARWPSARPLLAAWCARLGCDLVYPSDPDQLLLLHSELESLGEKRYELSATLRNRATYPLAYPYLELTLTNKRDEAVARRALAPAQWLPKGHDASSGFPAGQDIDIRVAFVTELPAVGYRVYFFYP